MSMAELELQASLHVVDSIQLDGKKHDVVAVQQPW